jgi:hypothetical protein
VSGEQVPAAVLGQWCRHLGAGRLGPPPHHKGNVCAVTAENGARYVLKEVVKEIGKTPRAERLVSEVRVLRHLTGRRHS